MSLRPIASQRRRSRGFSLIEIMIVVAIILVIASIAIPKINQQRMAAHEMAAIRTLTTIHTGQTQYFSQFGKYATTIQELGPPSSGQAGPAEKVAAMERVHGVRGESVATTAGESEPGKAATVAMSTISWRRL